MFNINNYARNTFGGLVRPCEFETNYGVNRSNRSYWADKIVSDFKFDKKCERNLSLYNKKVC